VFAERLIELVQPRLVLAVGRIAEGVLGDRASYIRHPANGGATAFAAGITEALGRVR
jgi:uracil-DNA glycosylase